MQSTIKNSIKKTRKTYTITLKKGSGRSYTKIQNKCTTVYGNLKRYDKYPTASSLTSKVIDTTITRIYTKGKDKYKKIVETVMKTSIKLRVEPPSTEIEISIDKMVPKVPKPYRDLLKKTMPKTYNVVKKALDFSLNLTNTKKNNLKAFFFCK